MNENFNKNAKFEQLTKMFLSSGEGKGLIVKDPYRLCCVMEITEIWLADNQNKVTFMFT